MIRFAHVTSVLAFGLAWNTIALAQGPPQYLRINCIKVRDGKDAEYSAYLRDVTTKLAKVRVDSGIYSAYIIAQATYPTGRSARCDYSMVSVFNGFPPEAPSPMQIEADMKRAGISMPQTSMVSKRDELSYLVGADVWRNGGGVGGVTKGGYARLNYYKSKPGMQAEWLRLETTGWKQLAESLAKDMPGMSWSVWALVMPGGDGLPYNGMTVDGFPTWDAIGHGIPAPATWSKVHPEMEFAQYIEKVNAVVDRPRIDVVKILDVITK